MIASLIAELNVFRSFARVGAVNVMAYRLRYYTGIATYFIYVSIYYFIWKAVLAHGNSIEGFNFSQMLTYIAVGWIIRSFYFNNIDQKMAYQVQEGKLAMDLIKPVNTQLMYVAEAFGQSCFRLILLTVPTALLLLVVFPLRLPAGPMNLAGFLLSVLLSFFLVAGINFCVGTFALRLKSILGLLRAKYFLLELFSGLLIPITFFPEWAQQILNLLPFPYISFAPVLIYLGKTEGVDILRTLSMQAFWVLVLLLAGHFLWQVVQQKNHDPRRMTSTR